MERTIYRQGDVLIERVANRRDVGDIVAREQGRIVLAHGEATGHAHAIDDVDATLYEAPTTKARHLRVVRPTALLHEEHSPIELPPGLYRVRRQREYHPDELRTVAD